MHRNRVKPLLYLLGTVLFWGSSFAATKSAYQVLAPMAVIWLRMLVAALAFAPFWARVPRPSYRRGDGWLLAASMAFIPCAYYSLEGFAMVYTTSSQAGVISATVPLIVALAAWVVLRERLSWQQLVGIVVTVVMVPVLALSGPAQADASNPLLGNLLELLAMLAAAGSMLTIKLLSARYHPWFLAGLQATCGAVFFTPLALASGPIAWAAVPPSAWLAIGYLGIFPGLVAFGLYNSALRLLPATGAAMAINLVPAVAMLTGWLGLGESLSMIQLIACVSIIAAVVFAEWASASPVPAPDGERAGRHNSPSLAPHPEVNP